MPRRPRIEIAGYYHIINRGVEQRAVYHEHEDYQYFLELLCTYAKSYGILSHDKPLSPVVSDSREKPVKIYATA